MKLDLNDFCFEPGEEIPIPETETVTPITRTRSKPKNHAFARISLDEITDRDNDWLYGERIRLWTWIKIKTKHGDTPEVEFHPGDAMDLGLSRQHRRRILRELRDRRRIALREQGRRVFITLLQPTEVP